ncbi:MAG: sigma-54-dependent Fis family transcriptional regulator [Candidatus Sumerlaeia bacterium]|nr:sigma-54-dependent Fis family transcriptional regulator [Candidatus Sumerlaeia bacterium]
MSGPRRILVIDDEPVVALSCERVLSAAGHRVETRLNPREGIEAALAGGFDLILLDIVMPEIDGLEVLRRLRAANVRSRILILTGYATVSTAVEAMKLGAADVLNKPFTPGELTGALAAVLNSPRTPDESSAAFGEMIGTSEPMRRVCELIERAAPADITVLISGETGTGKELAARAIHRLSPRASQPLIVCDCSALAPALLESELFGHARGAFTGATASKRGLFEVAHRGTLFLDELASLGLETQAKLLRVLETRTIRRVGETEERPVDIRLIGATNRDLFTLVAEGRFRDDLRHRLSVFPIHLPPLRERPADIPHLARAFLDATRERNPIAARVFSPETLALLERCPWPGNVRELRNVVERLAILCDGEVITPGFLSEDVRQIRSETPLPPLPRRWDEFREVKRRVGQATVEAMERRFLSEALERAGGNVTRAAQDVGMPRTHFHSLLAKCGLVNGRG